MEEREAHEFQQQNIRSYRNNEKRATCDLHEWNPVGHNSFSMWIGIIKAKTALDRVTEPCGGQALGATARRQGCATDVGGPSSGNWPTRGLPAPRNIKG